MGWGTSVKPEIYLNRITKSEIPDKLSEVTEDIELARMQFLILAARGSHRRKTEEGEILVHEYLPQEFAEHWRELVDNIRLQYQLELAQQNIETAEEG